MIAAAPTAPSPLGHGPGRRRAARSRVTSHSDAKQHHQIDVARPVGDDAQQAHRTRPLVRTNSSMRADETVMRRSRRPRTPRPSRMSAIAPRSTKPVPVTGLRRRTASCRAAVGPFGLPVAVYALDLAATYHSSSSWLLQPEHLLLLVRLGVVVAQQVQHAMDRQEGEFVVERMSGLLRLAGGELRAQHDVAEHRRAGLGRVGAAAWLELVHREAHHVGRARQVHPPHVQVGHGRGVDAAPSTVPPRGARPSAR